MSANERTEKPTPKRRADARKRGQVPRSTEVNSAAVLLGACAAFVLFGGRMLHQLEAMMRVGLEQAADPALATRGGLTGLTMWGLRSFALIAAPVILAALGAGVAANVAQVRVRFSPLALKPSFSKLNPLPGLKRLGKDGWIEAAKAIAKTGVVGLVAFLTIWPQIRSLGGAGAMSPPELLHELGASIRNLTVRVAVAFALIAAIDYAWQRRKHEKQLRMTRQELKQESRQGDIAPEVKRAIRRRQIEAARRRMLADVPTADVVVVNPTHFAVALRYDGSTSAPELIAKGQDLLAAAIRKVATEHEVPMVHNAPLARALYREVDLGQQIPEQFFQAVAEVLAFVFRTAGRRRSPLKRRARRPITGPHALQQASP